LEPDEKIRSKKLSGGITLISGSGTGTTVALPDPQSGIAIYLQKIGLLLSFLKFQPGESAPPGWFFLYPIGF
jgi:hypothetical protein